MTDLPLPSALTPADRMAIELIVKEVAARRCYGDAGRPTGDLAKRLQGRIWMATASLETTLRVVGKGPPEWAHQHLAHAIGYLVDGMVDLATEPVEQRVKA